MPLEGTLDVAVDHSVTFSFTVTNSGSDSRELWFRSGLAADFAVYRDGAEVWRWSDGRMFTQALEAETLMPGESVTYTGTWEAPPSGRYTAVATLEGTDADVETRTEFEV